MRVPPFVLPFTIGLLFIVIYIIYKWTQWIMLLPSEDKKLIRKNIFSFKTIAAIWENFLEALMHRKIFKKNFLLGYMHMALAFGWLMLIVMGNFESRLFPHKVFNPPYYPIFFEFFRHDLTPLKEYEQFFTFIMDFFLLVVLTGISIAFFKRFRSKRVGMKRTTKHIWIDRVALTSLWMIFPFRILAESVTAGLYNTGHFLTNFIGQNVIFHMPLATLYYPAWWAYSIALGLFFVTMPWSRYMHIPTEILLIFLRQYGIKEKDKHTTFTKVELSACSRCGICIDSCQLSTDLNIYDTQPTYFIRDLRNNKPSERLNDYCMMCMRCVDACPVGVEITAIRNNERKLQQYYSKSSFNYLNGYTYPKGKVAFFAGCMGHLTPSVIKSTLKLFDIARVDYTFVDQDGSICCGRPLQLTGQEEAAKQLMVKNKKLLEETGADILVTSCPICAREFNDSYQLGISVLHHTKFLFDLVQNHQLDFVKSETTIAYHDPCELGRGLGIYNEPRHLLNLVGEVKDTKQSKEKSLCCGGSLGILNLTGDDRKEIATQTLVGLNANNVDIVATACPLCKKSLQFATENKPISDISEILLSACQKKSDSQINSAKFAALIES